MSVVSVVLSGCAFPVQPFSPKKKVEKELCIRLEKTAFPRLCAGNETKCLIGEQYQTLLGANQKLLTRKLRIAEKSVEYSTEALSSIVCCAVVSVLPVQVFSVLYRLCMALRVYEWVDTVVA